MDKIFSDEFVANLPNDNTLALKAMCDEFHSFKANLASFTYSFLAKNYSSQILDAYAFLQAVVETRQIPSIVINNTLPSNLDDAIGMIIEAFEGLCESVIPQARNLIVKDSKEKYLQTLRGYSYDFSSGDIENIKKLIKELKDKIESCKDLEDDHKARALKKLNDLDSEINIRMTSLDKAYALIIEAQILVHKLGKEAKPFIKIIKKIVNFAWRAEARTEGLSSDTYLNLPEEHEIEALEHNNSQGDEEE